MEIIQPIAIKLERQIESKNKSEWESWELSCEVGEITKAECVQWEKKCVISSRRETEARKDQSGYDRRAEQYKIKGIEKKRWSVTSKMFL